METFYNKRELGWKLTRCYNEGKIIKPEIANYVLKRRKMVTFMNDFYFYCLVLCCDQSGCSKAKQPNL